MELNDSGEELLRKRQFALVEILAIDQIDNSVDNFFLHISALFGQGKFHKLIAVTDLVTESHPDWFLSPVSDGVPQLRLMYLKALVGTGSIGRGAEMGSEFLESALSRTVIDNIASHKDGSLLLAQTGLGDEARIALSDISFLVSRARKSAEESIKYALVAIHLNHANLEAWTDIWTGWSLSEPDKLGLVNSIRWAQEKPESQVLRLVRGWSLGTSPAEKDISDIGRVPDPYRTNQVLRICLFNGESDKIAQIIKQAKSTDVVLYDIETAPLLAAALYLQNDSVTLLQMVNKLLASYSDNPDSFFVAGIYYLSIQRFDVARKFFSRSTGTAHGWIAYGIAFAFSDESGHAINAFRTATRLYPKCLLPWLYIGMEYIRTNELKLAQSYLVSALALCGNENRFRALILNEIGIICLKAEQFDIAAENLRICCAGSEVGSSIFFANLGYALVKVRDVDAACRAFENSVRLNRSNGNALVGIGFCHHCKGSLSRAIDLYNSALPLVSGNRKTENLVNNLIQLAVNEYSFSVKQTHLALPEQQVSALISY